MTFYVENETSEEIPFDAEEIVSAVCSAVLKSEGCPADVQICVVLTDDENIREMNRETRGIDSATDVLSFPAMEFERPGEFRTDGKNEPGSIDPDSGELLLGDIMVSVDRMKAQAEEYGHSLRREFAFLIAHSMFHLCGYDHMEEVEAKVMEEKQEAILNALGITRG